MSRDRGAARIPANNLRFLGVWRIEVLQRHRLGAQGGEPGVLLRQACSQGPIKSMTSALSRGDTLLRLGVDRLPPSSFR